MYDHWANAEDWASEGSCNHICLLELRDRIAALEAAKAPSGLTRSPVPAAGLLQQVSAAICSAADSGDTPQNWAPEARAAILAVAKWLDIKGQHGCSLWLREEVERA